MPSEWQLHARAGRPRGRRALSYAQRHGSGDVARAPRRARAGPNGATGRAPRRGLADLLPDSEMSGCEHRQSELGLRPRRASRAKTRAPSIDTALSKRPFASNDEPHGARDAAHRPHVSIAPVCSPMPNPCGQLHRTRPPRLPALAQMSIEIPRSPPTHTGSRRDAVPPDEDPTNSR